ncbi:MAG: toll/interleukin-1 receptor domain-containing protein [Pseudomonadota bacterium]
MDVFISYSHKDRQWKDRVATFMRCMQIQGLVEYGTWDDGEIRPSEDWRNHIEMAIENCRIAVLLVSPDFLCSEFIVTEEVPQLLELRAEGRVAILPVIVRPCAWEVVEWLSEIQLHPAGGNALSGESEHDIEDHLKRLSLEIHRMLSEARAEAEMEAMEAVPIEAEADAPRSVVPADFRLFDEDEIESYLVGKYDVTVDRTLELFRTRKQRTWLVRTHDNALFCLLDSADTRAADRLLQWRIALYLGITVRVREKSRFAKSGLVDIGKRQNWLYSKQLHPDPFAFEAELRALVQAGTGDGRL